MNQNKIRLQHILDAIASVEEYIQDLDENKFYQDLKTQDAVIRKFEIIGEAVKNVSQELKLKAPGIPWKKAADLRNSLIHEYFEVDLPSLWIAIQKDIPQIKVQVETLMSGIIKDK